MALDVNNAGGGDSVLVDRDAGSDLLVNRGGTTWSAVPKSGHGLRSLGSVGSASVVWRTDSKVYRGNPNIADPTATAQDIPSDAGLWGNTGDGWLLGEGFTVNESDRFGGKFVHMATNGTTVHEYPNGPDANDDLNPPHMALGYSIVDDQGMVYVRTDWNTKLGDVHYIDFTTHNNTILYTTTAGHYVGQMVSMTPNTVSFFEIDNTNHKAVVHRVQRSTVESTKTTDLIDLPYTTASAAFQVAVADNGVAWSSLSYPASGPPVLAGLHSKTTLSGAGTQDDTNIALPPGLGQLMARTSDFVFVANDNTTAAEVRHFAPLATTATAFDALPVPSSADVVRKAGATRFDTSAAISSSYFSPGVSKVYIANGLNFPDALSGASVAAMNNSPILLVPGTSIPAPIDAELTRLQPAQIVVLGGTGAVSASVFSALQSYTTGSVTRVFGPDRYSTSMALSRANFAPGVSYAFIANGLGFADALAGAPVAGMKGAPVLLCGATSIPDVVKTELARLQPQHIVVLGGTGAISASVASALAAYTPNPVTREGGATRFDTAAKIVTDFFVSGTPPGGGYHAFLSNGNYFADALGAAPVAGAGGNPIVLIPGTYINDSAGTALDGLAPTGIAIVGGTGVMTLEVQQDLGTYITP